MIKQFIVLRLRDIHELFLLALNFIVFKSIHLVLCSRDSLKMEIDVFAVHGNWLLDEKTSILVTLNAQS